MRAWLLVNVIVAFAACRADSAGGPEALDPVDFHGVYPLAMVDGQAVGWYHDTANNCQVAFTSDGKLTISSGQPFLLALPYVYRCLDGNGSEGSSFLYVVAGRIESTATQLQLQGYGPDPIGPGVMPWLLEVTPNGEYLQVRFKGAATLIWADPILTLGPRIEPGT
jgi:hypothetical protein